MNDRAWSPRQAPPTLPKLRIYHETRTTTTETNQPQTSKTTPLVLQYNQPTYPEIPSSHLNTPSMASMLLRPLLRPQTLGLGLGLSLATLQVTRQRPLKLDSASVLSPGSYKRDAQTPVVRNGALNPAAVKQISSGSIIGMLRARTPTLRPSGVS